MSSSMYAKINEMLTKRERETQESANFDAESALSAAIRKVRAGYKGAQLTVIQKALWRVEEEFKKELGIEEV